ncbi:MAG: lysylphosphatidylglycerol synthase transmembrane domain-containing protein [Candidatus Omnitrophica bacterium]|nr:lysylphosphatidylglycerol synthase transmembrane domain-containing protein [Candidatus Omnitrophota bacterium]
MKNIKQALLIILRIAISIALLIFLFRQVNRETMFETVRGANKYLLIAAFLVYFFTYLICLYRWQMLLKASGIHLPLKRVIISFSGGIFFSLFLPSSIGGDFMRSVDLALFTRKPRQIVATVLLDRLSGYVGLVILTLLAVLFGWKLVLDRSIVIAICILIVVLVIALLVLFNKFVYSRINKFLGPPGSGRIREAIGNLHQEMHYFRNHKKVMVNNVILSILVQAVAPLTFYLIALAIGVKLDLVYFFIFLPIIGAVTLLPVSIGGLGLRDAMTIFFFGKIGMAKDLAFAMSLLSFLFMVIYGSIGGLIYVLTIRHRRIQPDQPSAVFPGRQEIPGPPL